MIATAKRLPQRLLSYASAAGHRIATSVSSRRRVVDVGASVSLCGRERLIGVQRVADDVRRRGMPGDIVECGVFRGGSAVVIADRLLRGPEPRTMWLFDVFSGMPEPGPEDPPEAWADVGKFVSSPETVRQTFARARVPDARVQIVPGLYEQTLPGFTPGRLALLHLDCDWYDSLKLCLHTFYDAVAPGGAVILDDYGHWSGCRAAVDEFLAERAIQVRLTAIDYTSHYFIKP